MLWNNNYSKHINVVIYYASLSYRVMKSVCKSVYVWWQEDRIVTPPPTGHTSLMWLGQQQPSECMQCSQLARDVKYGCTLDSRSECTSVGNHVTLWAELCLDAANWYTNSWVINCNCNCNLFTFHKSELGYNPVDIEIVTCILYNTIYTLLGES